MAASYPTSSKSFSTKATTNVIEASHVNDLQDEVTAIETALLTGGLAHNVIPSGTRTLGNSSTFWDKGYVTALILGAETTSGIRLEVDGGVLGVREGDDSAFAPLTAGALIATTATLSGLLTVNGYGAHEFSASGAGGNTLRVRNLSNNAGAYSQFSLGNDLSADRTAVYMYSSTVSPSGPQQPDALDFRANGAGGMSIGSFHASGAIRFYSGGTTLRAQINPNGTQTWAPYGAGTATFDASGNITSASDARLKDRISPLPYGLAEVLQLRPVQHGYNEISGLDRIGLYGGFLAQDVGAVMPLAVGRNSDGYLTLSDRPILGAVVNAVQQHDARIAALEARLGAA